MKISISALSAEVHAILCMVSLVYIVAVCVRPVYLYELFVALQGILCWFIAY